MPEMLLGGAILINNIKIELQKVKETIFDQNNKISTKIFLYFFIKNVKLKEMFDNKDKSW